MKFLSLFAGIGGFDLGLERAGMECIGQVEIDKFCNKILEKHWPHVKRMRDIKEVKGNEFGAVDLVCGGFPCQPFSVAGQKKGEQDNRHLWPEMFRIIKQAKPTWVIGENVSGIINMALDKVLFDLETQDYTAWTFIIPACAIGAIHKRERVWILANSKSKRLSWGKRQKTRHGFKTEILSCETIQEKIPPPYVCGANDGISNRMDRLKCLGNAVVPQIPEIIGRAIMEIEKNAPRECEPSERST